MVDLIVASGRCRYSHITSLPHGGSSSNPPLHSSVSTRVIVNAIEGYDVDLTGLPEASPLQRNQRSSEKRGLSEKGKIHRENPATNKQNLRHGLFILAARGSSQHHIQSEDSKVNVSGWISPLSLDHSVSSESWWYPSLPSLPPSPHIELQSPELVSSLRVPLREKIHCTV